MKTKQETITATVYIYAKAKTKYQLKNLEPGELPFQYEVKDYDYGDEASVRIMEHEITIPIPGGIDVTQKCIENLREKISAVEKQARKDIEDLNDRISRLALIEYKPNARNAEDWVDGEVVGT